MADWYVYLLLVVSIVVSFWSALLEATYLTVRSASLVASSEGGDGRADKALQIISQKTKLVSSTTLLSTVSDVVIASSVGLILSGAFGLLGWAIGTIMCSLLIMVFLNLFPKAIGIENSVRMALSLASVTSLLLSILSPAAVPLTKVAKTLSQAVVGKPAYEPEDLVEEFENLLIMLEKAGHIEPDSGRILRSALASSKTTAGDLLTPIGEIVSVNIGASVRDALRLMGKSTHPHLPVYDAKAKVYVGVVTFRSLFGAFDAGGFADNVLDYMVQPAWVDSDATAATVMDRMRSAGVTMAFVSQRGKTRGMVTVTDILEVILGTKVERKAPPDMT